MIVFSESRKRRFVTLYVTPKATRINVQVIFKPTKVSLTVEDNGIGFTVPGRLSTLAKDNHFGLIGADEHAHLIGAKLKIDSVLEKGTRLEVAAPLALASSFSEADPKH